MRSERGWGRGSASSGACETSSRPSGYCLGSGLPGLPCPRVRSRRAPAAELALLGWAVRGCGGQRKDGGQARAARRDSPHPDAARGPRGPGALSARISPFDLAERMLPALAVFSRKGFPSWVWVPPASSPAPPTRSELSPSPRPSSRMPISAKHRQRLRSLRWRGPREEVRRPALAPPPCAPRWGEPRHLEAWARAGAGGTWVGRICL